jgi:hypothetical protein
MAVLAERRWRLTAKQDYAVKDHTGDHKDQYQPFDQFDSLLM